MKKIALMIAATAVVATASFAAPSAYAKPAFNKNMTLGNGSGNGGGGGAWKSPYGYQNHGGYWGGGLGLVGAGLALAAAANNDCFYVRRRVFVPGVGVLKRRELVCS